MKKIFLYLLLLPTIAFADLYVVIDQSTGDIKGAYGRKPELSAGQIMRKVPDGTDLSRFEFRNGNVERSLASAKNDLQRAIRLEAEKRINEGTQIPGIGMFKTDNGSITRLQGLYTLAQLKERASEPVDITFTTSAGQTINITSAAQVGAVMKAAGEYVALILQKSSEQSTAVETMTLSEIDSYDVTNPSNWR